jgi:hypothetical protein
VSEQMPARQRDVRRSVLRTSVVSALIFAYLLWTAPGMGGLLLASLAGLAVCAAGGSLTLWILRAPAAPRRVEVLAKTFATALALSYLLVMASVVAQVLSSATAL